MRIKFWGTRGSLPTAMTHDNLMGLIETWLRNAKAKGTESLDAFHAFLKTSTVTHPLTHGGNTSCYEITHEKQSFFVDLGSGLRDAGTKAIAENRSEFVFFLTHMHWDHLLGFNFFLPIYKKDQKIIIYHVHKNAPEHVRICFNGINYPVKWEDLGSKAEFRQIKPYEKVQFKDITVTPFSLDHPGGSFGYRFDTADTSVAIGVDGEYKRLTPQELGKDLPYYQNLDLLIFDAQYEIEELASRFDWGHCSPPIGIDLALREGIKNLALTHHDPWATEEKLQESLARAKKHLQTQLPLFKSQWEKLNQKGPSLYSAYDGLEINLAKV